jgi:glycerophosphoryl diester phosphodiesterase
MSGSMMAASDTTEPSQGVAIDHRGRRVLLKWHRMRRRMTDPLFGIDMLKEGLRLGASMEFDLRIARDGGFAVVHDETLDRETDGTGRVSDHDCPELASHRYMDSQMTGDWNTRRLMLVDDVVPLLAEGHPAALVQFDMKDGLAAVGDRGIDRLAGLFDGRNVPAIFSGDCEKLIMRIKERLPHLKTGIDPTDRLVALYREGRNGEVEKQLRSEMLGPTQPDTVYLAWDLVLSAEKKGLDLVDICHSAGKKVDAWTFTLADPQAGFSDREWESFSALLDLGADQVTTDEAIATELAYARRVPSV